MLGRVYRRRRVFLVGLPIQADKSSKANLADTRHLRVFKKNPNHLLIAGAGVLPPSTTNTVTVSVIDITASLLSAT